MAATDKIEVFLAEPRNVIVAGIRRDGRPHMPDDDEHLRALTAEGRVLLAITPDGPPASWTSWGLD